MTENNLSDYNKKRNFENTVEPVGEREQNLGSLRFVVQHHIARRDHYDFRLEWKGAMLSWAVPKGPSYNTQEKRLAIKVEDHPLEYRNFEGTIPKGQYGGGTVMIWDEGCYLPSHQDIDEGLREGIIKFELQGRRLKGKWCLVQIKDKKNDDKDNWLLFKEKDSYAKNEDGISQFVTSIRTNRTMQEIADKKAKENPFKSVNAQLAKFVSSIPSGDNWLFELKYDGYRIIAYIENSNVKLISRNGKDYTKHFQPIAHSLVDLANGKTMVLDGEVTATDAKGKINFQALQNYIKDTQNKRLTYFIFDILALEGEDIRNRKLIDRKNLLEDLMQNAPNNLQYSRHFQGNGKEVFAAACKENMEGVIAKRADSVYSGTRNNDWLKIKCDNRQEFVIGGYSLSNKKTSGVSSLLLGAYQGEELIFYGRAGTGFTEAVMKDLEKKFENIKTKECPFKNKPKASKNENIFWLQPKYIAEIKYAEITEEKLLRQASFKGLRDDKAPKDVRFDVASEELLSQDDSKEQLAQTKPMPIIKEIKITSPDKIIYENPKKTKADVVQYYLKVANRILPYISKRIISIVRCPKGVNESCFYKKHPGPGSKGIVTVPIPNGDKDREDFFYIDSAIGLINEAQMGTLEFHTWASKAHTLEKPDIMVFDLDPDEGMDIDRVRQGVKDLKIVLDELNLKSYLKTSGGKGYHVVVPFKPLAAWDKFYDFAKSIAQVMEIRWNDRYTSNMRKVKRQNKIFIDWVRNTKGATSVAPYSLRAREGAKVSMPIFWDELDTVAPDGIDMDEAIKRLAKKDPWQDFFENDQQIN